MYVLYFVRYISVYSRKPNFISVLIIIMAEVVTDNMRIMNLALGFDASEYACNRFG